MAIAQRTIHISRTHISANRIPRKAFPKALKTLGDHIQFKRVEKGLNPHELAHMVGVAMPVVKAWESDVELPNEREWLLLVRLLSLNSDLKTPKPNT